MERRRIVVAALSAAALLTSVAACGGAGGAGGASAPAGPVTIGESTTLSGPIAELGQSGLQGVKMAAADLNARGGVLGHKVRVVSADDALAPATGASNVRSMILNDHAVAIFGPVSSAVAAAEEPIAAQYQTPIFFHTSNDISLMGKGFTKYAFQVVPNTVMESRAAADYLAKVSAGKQITVATFAPAYSFGYDTVNGFIQALKDLHVNYKLVAQEFPPVAATSISSYLSRIVTAKPEYLFNAQFGGDLVTFTQQAAGYGLFAKTKVIAMYDYPVLAALGTKAPAGAIGFDRLPFWAVPGLASFSREFRSKYGTWPSEWAILGYTAVQTWAYGVEHAHSFSGGKVAAALSGATVPTIRGPITIRSCDHQAMVPEYVGTVASSPNPVYHSVLWNPSSMFTAPFATIDYSCTKMQSLRG
ncbi:MAG: ABC transporter substrate-binding protein [Streptosporangiaceae bacterium]